MIHVYAKIHETQPFDVTKRKWLEWCREGYRAMAKWWHDNLLPLHFKVNSRDRYGYKPRSGKYMAAKRKAAARGKVQSGGAIDLIYTGAMREQLQSVAEIRAYPTRATLNMTGPRYMTMDPFFGDRSKGYRYGKGQVISATAGTQPDKVAEATRVLESEAEVLSNILAGEVAKRYNEYRQPKTTVPVGIAA